MQGCTTPEDLAFLREAVLVAREAEKAGNLPIGALVVLDGWVVARGANSIYKPKLSLTRHAEMEALRTLPSRLWRRAKDMTLYTTLEPCVMCAGAILLHGVGRIVFGAVDPQGGASAILGDLPQFFREALTRTQWCGPGLPLECDPLYAKVVEIEARRSER